MIQVLHFAHIINRYDIIDTVLTRLDRSRFRVSALTGSPPRHEAPYAAGERYETRCLNIGFHRANYPRMFVALLREIRRVRPHIVHIHHYDENLVASLALRLARMTSNRAVRYIAHRHYSNLIDLLTRGLKRAIFLAGERFYIAGADRVLVPVPGDARTLMDRQRVPATKVEVQPFGFDFGRATPSSPGAPCAAPQAARAGGEVRRSDMLPAES